MRGDTGTDDWDGSQVPGLGDWVDGSAINEEQEYRRKGTLQGRARKTVRSAWRPFALEIPVESLNIQCLGATSQKSLQLEKRSAQTHSCEDQSTSDRHGGARMELGEDWVSEGSGLEETERE